MERIFYCLFFITTWSHNFFLSLLINEILSELFKNENKTLRMCRVTFNNSCIVLCVCKPFKKTIYLVFCTIDFDEFPCDIGLNDLKSEIMLKSQSSSVFFSINPRPNINTAWMNECQCNNLLSLNVPSHTFLLYATLFNFKNNFHTHIVTLNPNDLIFEQ